MASQTITDFSNLVESPEREQAVKNEKQAAEIQSSGVKFGGFDPLGTASTHEITLGDEFIVSNLSRFGNLKNSETARIALMVFKQSAKTGLISPAIRTADTFYIEAGSVKSTVIAPKDPELLRQAIQIYGDPKPRFGTIILVYVVRSMGGPPQCLSAELQSWVFGYDKWVPLKQANDQFPLSKHDLQITCVEQNFRRWNITAANEHLFSKIEDEQYKENTKEEANRHFDGILTKRLGRSITDGQWYEVLQGNYSCLAFGAAGTSGVTPQENPKSPFSKEAALLEGPGVLSEQTKKVTGASEFSTVPNPFKVG